LPALLRQAQISSVPVQRVNLPAFSTWARRVRVWRHRVAHSCQSLTTLAGCWTTPGNEAWNRGPPGRLADGLIPQVEAPADAVTGIRERRVLGQMMKEQDAAALDRHGDWLSLEQTIWNARGQVGGSGWRGPRRWMPGMTHRHPFASVASVSGSQTVSMWVASGFGQMHSLILMPIGFGQQRRALKVLRQWRSGGLMRVCWIGLEKISRR